MGKFVGNDRFRVVRTLGTGGSGAVYEVHDLEQDAHVALKTLMEVEPGSLYRFKKEFRALADVSHPNLVSFHELISHEGQFFLTMEMIEGGVTEQAQQVFKNLSAVAEAASSSVGLAAAAAAMTSSAAAMSTA